MKNLNFYLVVLAAALGLCHAQSPCEPNPCLNGGTCVTDGNSFNCECAPGYFGATCTLACTQSQLDTCRLNSGFGTDVDCFPRPLPDTAPPDDFDFVCNCSMTRFMDAGHDCSQRTGLPHRDFITCYNCPTGSFESENYPELYPNDWTAVYLLYIPGASRIDFQFVGEGGFGIESFKDELYIGTGFSYDFDVIQAANQSENLVNGRVVRFYDNDTAMIDGILADNPPLEYPPAFSLETDTVWFYFRTDKNLRFNGWRVQWTSIVDNVGPTIVNCPDDIITSVEQGLALTVEVTWVEPFANDASPPIDMTQTHFPGQLFVIGTTVVTYTFRDRFGNAEICSFSVIVNSVDSEPPVIVNCPGDIQRTIELGADDPVIIWAEPSATDSSGVEPTLSLRSHQPGSTFSPGTTLVTYIFQDLAGLTATCTFNVVIITEDTTPPDISGCPSTIQETVELGIETRSVIWVEPTATDNSGSVVLVSRSHPPGADFPVGNTFVEYVFGDNSGNEALCRFAVLVIAVDTTPPFVPDCPQAISMFIEVGQPGTTVTWIVPTSSDASNNVAVVPSHNPGQFFIAGLTTVTYLFTDETGNSARCSFCVDILLQDTLNPVITGCPQDQTITIELGEQFGVAFWGRPTATDNSGTADLVLETHSPGAEFSIGQTTVMYVFADPTGNQATCSFSITVITEDTVPPMIVGCPTTITEEIELGTPDPIIVWNVPTATDESGTQMIAVQTHFPGTAFTVGVTMVLYTFSDAAGNSASCSFIVNVIAVDTTPPTISGCPTAPIVGIVELGRNGVQVEWEEPIASDLSPPVTVMSRSHVPNSFFLVGPTTVEYVFVDSFQNAATCSFEVQVIEQDRVAPVVTCPADIIRVVELGTFGDVVEYPPETVEDEDPNTVLISRTHDSGAFFPLGLTTVTITYSDTSNNIGECSFGITINTIDTEPPVIDFCPDDQTVIIELGLQTMGAAFWALPTATDISGVANIIIESHQSGAEFPIGVTTVRYIFSDDANPPNTATCDFVITVNTVDTTPPMIMDCPDDIFLTVELGVSSAVAVWQPPTATDNSRTPSFQLLASQSHQPGQLFPLGTEVVTYIFTDPADLSSVCEFTVTVTPADSVPPTIDGCPVIIREMVELGSFGGPVPWVDPTASDLSGVVTITTQSHTPGSFFTVGQTEVTYVFTDASGNSADCIFQVLVIEVDTTPPEIIGCPDDITETFQLGTPLLAVSWTLPTATDQSNTQSIISQSHQPGALFPTAQWTLVEIVFADETGNTNTCQFCVQFISIDTVPPTISNCPNDVTVVIELGIEFTGAAFWVLPTASDLSGVADLADQTHQPGDEFIIGETEVTYTFVDASGNVALCTFRVIVETEDTTPPTLEFCPDDQEITVELGVMSSVAFWQEPIAADNSGVVNLVSQTHMSGDEFPIGMTTVVYIFEDPEGFRVICMFVITVTTEDTTAPNIIGCPLQGIEEMVECNLPGRSVFWDEPTAMDVSGVAMVSARSHVPGQSFPIGVTMVSYTFTDASGNSAMCEFPVIVTAVDTTPPVTTEALDSIRQIVELGVSGDFVMWEDPTATDACSQVFLIEQTHRPGDFFLTDQGTTVCYEFADAAGNTARTCFCVELIEVDRTPPMIFGCPDDIEVNVELGENGVAVSWPEPNSNDLSGTDELRSRSNEPDSFFFVSSATVTYIFADASGNVAECSFIVTVAPVDNTPPDITGCPDDFGVTVELGETRTTVTWTDPSASDLSGTATLSSRSHTPNDEFLLGPTTVTYVFTDSSNNAASCQFTITVTTVDTTPPDIIGCPDDQIMSVELGIAGANIVWVEPFATDTSGTQVLDSRSHAPGNFFEVGVTTVSYIYSDASMNMNTCTFNVVITAVDTTPPTISGCPTTDVVEVVELGEVGAFATWPIPSATDLSDPVTVNVNNQPGAFYLVGTTIITYTFVDAIGNQDMCIFNVVVITDDTTPPVVSGCPVIVPEVIELGTPGVTATWPTPSATDLSGEVSILMVTQDPGSFFFVGDTTVTYTFVDSSGNTAMCEFIVRVTTEDTTPPDIMGCPADIVEIIELGSTDPSIFWIDPMAQDLSPTRILSQSATAGQTFPVGTTMVTFIFADSSNNNAICSFSVTVMTTDTTPPTITGCPQPGDVAITIELGQTGTNVAVWVEPSASDLSGTATLDSRSHAPREFFPLGQTLVMYVFVDASGNQAFCQFPVVVTPVDTIPPVILNCPEVVTQTVEVGLMGVIVIYDEPTATDVSEIVILTTQSHAPGDFFPVGLTTVTYTFSDNVGNSESCMFMVRVIEVDTTPPVVEDCPILPPQIIELGMNGEAVNWQIPSAGDISGTAMLVRASHQPGAFFLASERTTVEYLFRDASGNTVTCRFCVEFIFQDTTPPVIIRCPMPPPTEVELGTPSVIVTYAEPLAMDNSNSLDLLQTQTCRPGDLYNVGETACLYIFVDPAGNANQCEFSIVVTTVDTTPPDISNCPDSAGTIIELGTLRGAVFWTVPTASDLAGATLLPRTVNPGDLFDIGTTTVIYRFVDPSGNERVCSFVVTVTTEDTTSPVCVGTPSDISESTELGNPGTTVIYPEPTCSDASNAATVTQQTHSSPSFFPLGDTQVVYTCTDPSGNQQECMFFVTVFTVDTVRPRVVGCAGDEGETEVVELGTTSAVVTFNEPTATDESQAVTVISTCNSGDSFIVGMTECIFTFTDPSGNSAECVFTVNVVTEDTTPPTVLQCPTVPIVAVIELGVQTAMVQYVEPTAFDLSQAPDLLQTQTCNPGDSYNVGETSCIYLFVDPSGNRDQCTFRIIVQTEDTTPPVISNCPQEASTVVELGTLEGRAFWTEPSASDLDEAILESRSHMPGALFPVGTTIVTYIYQDPSGNRETCSFPVTVTTVDRIPPVIENCPDDILRMIELGEAGVVISYQPPSATDVSGMVNVVSTNDPGFYPPGRIMVVYTFTDASGNSAECSFTIEVVEVDTTPPVITNCPTPQIISIELGMTSGTATWPEPSASDISGTARLSVRSHTPGQGFTLGDTTVMYQFVDDAGNSATCRFCVSVITIDTTEPRCTNLPGEISRVVELGTPGVTVSPLPEPICVDISGTGFVSERTHVSGDFFLVGETSVFYTCSDESGNTAVCPLTVRVVTMDTTPPEITGCPGPQAEVIELGEQSVALFWIVPTASDVSGVANLRVNTHNPGDMFPVGSTTVVYTFTDASENSETCMFVVTITTEDTTPPEIIGCPDMITRVIELGTQTVVITWTEPSALDISGTSMLRDRSHAPNTPFPVGVTQVEYRFRDASGNEAVCAFMIVISTEDTTPPNCVNVPALVFETTELGTSGTVVSWTELMCEDISMVAMVTARSHVPPSFFPVGLTTVTYTCTDGAGNSQECPFNVQVSTVDTTPPAITQCPGIDAMNVIEVIELGTTSAIVTFPEPMATDASNDVRVVSTCNSGGRFPVGTIMCTFTFSDPSDNSDACTFPIEVQTEDTTPPTVLQCPQQPVVVVVELGTMSTPVTYVEPTAFDASNAPNLLQTQTCMPGNSYQVGENNCLYFFADPSGNMAQCTFLIIVNTEDTTPPTISNCPNEAGTVVELGTAEGNVAWTVPTASDLDSAILASQTGFPGTAFPVGTTTVVYTFEDPSGNQAICVIQVTVTTEDTTPPTISDCPDDMIEVIELGQMGVVKSWDEPTATDVSGVANLIVRTNAPGEFYRVGSITIRYEFQDASGNTAICTFQCTVIEEDTTPPNIQCPNNVPVIVEILEGGGIATFPLATASDLSGDVTVTCSGTSGAFYPTGTTEITCTAVDSSGNQATCTFNIIVTEVDTIPPTVVCPEDIFVLVIEGSEGAYVDDYGGPVFKDDNSGSATITSIQPEPGSLFPIGSTQVVIVASDAANNVASCFFNIVVSTGNPCDPDPCQNGAYCVIDSLEQFQCICPECYFGDLCQFEMNACDNHNCQNGAACVQVDGSCTLFTCECPECFSGDVCQNFQDACQNNDCRNGANCLQNAGCVSYTCSCPACFEGEFCERSLNPCSLATCANGGQCIPDTLVDCSGYACICSGCFAGIQCDIEIDPCNPSPCRNGAQCSRDASNCYQYTCECVGCFQGPNCEVAIPDPCLFGPCQNGALCTRLSATCNAYRCSCPPGFGGFNCDQVLQINRNPCNSFPCEAGATCLPTATDGYVCLCRDGYAGINCGQFAASLPVLQLACNSFPCQNGGSCQNSYDSSSSSIVYESQYTCTCPPNFSGTNCQIPVLANPLLNVCAGSDCQNGGMCLNTYSSFTSAQIYQCQCPVGYVGQDCEIPAINPCDSDPCQNGGSCRPFNTYFLCQCIGGFSGTFCQIPPDTSRPLVIGCPENDIVVTAVDGSNTAPATWAEPRVVGGDQSVLEYQSHMSGALFMGGSTPVTYVYGDLNNQYTCCMFFVVVRGTNRCLGLPCWNGGRCLETGPVLCDCTGTGFTGPTCDDAAVSPCDPSPCLNGGTCGIIGNGFNCQCPSGFFGPTCATAPCAPNPCENGGTCIPQGMQTFTCICEQGFQGTTCNEVTPSGDTTAPTVTGCPGRIEFYGFPSSSDNFLFSWTEPTATDAGGAVTVSQSHSPGFAFPFGVPTEVTYNFTDPSLNLAQCQFTVDFDSDPPFNCRDGRNPCLPSQDCSRVSGMAEVQCTPASGRKKRSDWDISELLRHESVKCPCMNGGVCSGTDNIWCMCPEEFEGILCEVRRDIETSTNTQTLSLVVISLLALIAVVLVALTCIVTKLVFWSPRSLDQQKLIVR